MSLYKKIRYRVDKSLTRSLLSVIFILIAVVTSIVLFISLIDYFFINENSKSFLETFFDYFIASIKGNSIGNSSALKIFLNIILISTSLFVSSVFIGLIVNNIRERILSIRKGQSFVLESGHQIILGWSPGINLIIKEFLIANESNNNCNLLILDEMDPVEMNTQLLKMFPDKKDYQRIIPKQGSTYDRYNLERININESKSILINHIDDMKTIKTIAAIINNPNRKEEPYNIVTKINSKKNFQLAKIIGGSEAKILYFGDMLSRIDAQTCLQDGLAIVFLELVNFDGDEIYFTNEPSLHGSTYREAVLGYDSSSVIGIQKEGKILISPSFNEKIGAEDKIISISEDDDRVMKDGIKPSKDTLYNEKNIIKDTKTHSKVERVFIFGYADYDMSRTRVICSHLIEYLDSKSEIILVNDNKASNELAVELTSSDINILFIYGDVRSRTFLDSIDFRDEDKILILSPFNGLNDIEECDAQTLFTLINIRDIQNKSHKNLAITTELVNSKNAEIFQSEKDDDYLYSEIIVQSMLVQIAENPDISTFFDYLVSPLGSEIYFKPITDYVDISEPIDFYSICESAGLKGETAFGYQKSSENELLSLDAGVIINPLKSEKRTFAKNDKVIVFAEGL